MSVKSICAGLMLAILAVGQGLAAPEIKIADNVFVVPDPKAKVVTLYMIVRAGCRDEEGGQCRGLAHYLEHLVFLGRSAAPTDGDSAFAAGQTNAFTTMEVTSYYQSIPVREASLARDLDSLFGLFAKRLTGVDMEPDVAARERNVVLQEYNFRRAGSIRTKFYRDLNTRLQPTHPVSQAVIGARSDIEAFSLEAAQKFHSRWYGKNNVTFVLYGPVGENDIKPLVAKYFDPLPTKKIPSRNWLDARRNFEPMDETLQASDPEAQRQEVLLEKIVRLEESDPQTADNATAILFDYLNSQISGSLWDIFVEEKRMATSVRISSTSFGEGVFWASVSATLEDGTSPEAMKSGIETYLAELAKRGVDSSVVERMKRRRSIAYADVSKDPKRVLSSLTGWFAGLRTHSEWLERSDVLASVTPARIQLLLDALAGPGRQVFGILSPKK